MTLSMSRLRKRHLRFVVDSITVQFNSVSNSCKTPSVTVLITHGPYDMIVAACSRAMMVSKAINLATCKNRADNKLTKTLSCCTQQSPPGHHSERLMPPQTVLDVSQIYSVVTQARSDPWSRPGMRHCGLFKRTCS
jgi:hypothetical protein